MQVAKLPAGQPHDGRCFRTDQAPVGQPVPVPRRQQRQLGVAWHRFAAFPNIFFKRRGRRWVALGPLKPMTSGGRALTMETADPDKRRLRRRQDRGLQLEGAAGLHDLYRGGCCQSQCPAWNTGKPLSPKILIRQSLARPRLAKAPCCWPAVAPTWAAREVGLVDADGNELTAKLEAIPEAARAQAQRPLVGEANGNEGVARSSTPRRCGAAPTAVRVWSSARSISSTSTTSSTRRYQVLIESDFPSELAGPVQEPGEQGQPVGQSPSAHRVDRRDGHPHPGVRQGRRQLRRLRVPLLSAAPVPTRTVRRRRRRRSPSCSTSPQSTSGPRRGEMYRRLGPSRRQRVLFQMLAQQNIEQVDELFATAPHQRKKTDRHLCTLPPTPWQRVPAGVDGERGWFEVVHHTQLLNRLVREKAADPRRAADWRVRHPPRPVLLGRYNQVHDAARARRGVGPTLTEMFPATPSAYKAAPVALACGWRSSLGKRINIDRVDEALDTLESGPDPMGGREAEDRHGCPFRRVMLTGRRDGADVGHRKAKTRDRGRRRPAAAGRRPPRHRDRRGSRGASARPATSSSRRHRSSKKRRPRPSPTPKPAAAWLAAAAPADAKPGAVALPAKGGLGMKGGMVA